MTLKDFATQFIPGPKAVTVLLGSLFLFLDHKLKVGISDTKVLLAAGTVGAYLIAHYQPMGVMNLRDWLLLFVPGPKALAMVLTPALIFVDERFKLGIPVGKVGFFAASLSVYLLTFLMPKKAGDVDPLKVPAIPKPATPPAPPPATPATPAPTSP